jgi:hypothetical protein
MPAAAAAPLPEEMAPTARRVARAARARQRARWRRPGWLAVPGPSTVVAAAPIAVPILAAGIAWAAVVISGRPALPPDEARLLLVGLALVGPLGALAGFIARTWFPQLAGLVVISAVMALAVLTRTILA